VLAQICSAGLLITTLVVGTLLDLEQIALIYGVSIALVALAGVLKILLNGKSISSPACGSERLLPTICVISAVKHILSMRNQDVQMDEYI
jgi:hypothetical protein